MVLRTHRGVSSTVVQSNFSLQASFPPNKKLTVMRICCTLQYHVVRFEKLSSPFPPKNIGKTARIKLVYKLKFDCDGSALL